jgi:predicted GNAT family acetyltransferase
MDAESAVIDNVRAGRFELVVDGELRSFANYREENGALVVPHVETVQRYRGNGFAEHLMDGVVINLRQTGRQIVPACSFAAQYLWARPDTHDLLPR